MTGPLAFLPILLSGGSVATAMAPNFSDDGGNSVAWIRSQTAVSITVPQATGTPEPMYSASGLPAGVTFNTSTRQITGTPTSTGNGTITVTATNSQGSDTWTVNYSISSPPPAIPQLATPTITALTGSISGSIRVDFIGVPNVLAGYRFYYSTSPGVNATDSYASINLNIESADFVFINMGFVLGTTYYFRAQARGDGVNYLHSALSSEVSVTMPSS